MIVIFTLKVSFMKQTTFTELRTQVKRYFDMVEVGAQLSAMILADRGE